MSQFLTCTVVYFLKIKISRYPACEVSAYPSISKMADNTATFDQNISRTKQDIKKLLKALFLKVVVLIKQTQDKQLFAALTLKTLVNSRFMFCQAFLQPPRPRVSNSDPSIKTRRKV